MIIMRKLVRCLPRSILSFFFFFNFFLQPIELLFLSLGVKRNARRKLSERKRTNDRGIGSSNGPAPSRLCVFAYDPTHWCAVSKIS